MTAAVAVDLGKTGCRAVLWNDGAGPAHDVHEVPGAPGLATGNGAAAARAAVRAAVLPLLAREPSLRPAALCVGAAGAAAAPEAARALAGLLLGDLPVDEVAVTSDAVTAHAGALGGRTGVVLAIGTGAVAVGIGDDRSCARVDGWGPWLGDEGGGAWIGAAGLRAALRAHDGRGPDTALLAAAAERFGDLDRLPSAVGRDGNPARTAASFAPDVARAAAAGDAAASAIVRDAATALGEAVLAAARRIGGDALPVTVTGGLTKLGEPLLGPLRSLLTGSPRPLHLRPPLGDPLDGARLLALDASAPHEAHVVRVRRTTPLHTVPAPPATPPAAV
ncbi:BadF/BadG/BcrA/BcrD ATPase family protein [Streptomyces sp. TG1A-8]|uniref:BadF/BadG/BcrA/BcrD ATPase family protein n=1 Tax=Streptomyces sp. TG1A-8 TaxID=3051385 RepID=UPI00265BAAEA|nr:BadF/BadG/BcrA/BcrD ATPase family protein [Streptomyces sp. TG1A-8]MDO0924183.1 BadF/BadG/BcrA/BcrD ATPase family protein [Streptomyces sp. TG1A-8]